MTAITLVTADAGGNVPPLLAVARSLVARGAAVQILGHERQRADAEATGARFEALDSLAFWDSGVRRSLVSSLAQFSRLGADRRIGAEVRERAERHGARAALVDCMTASSAVALRDRGVPVAVLFHTFLAFWAGAYARGPVGAVARLRGLDLRAAWAGADRRLVAAEADLDPAHGREALSAEWVGSCETGTPAHPDPAADPLVVVSLSTTWLAGQTDVYQRIATALGSLGVRAVITAGGLAPDRALELPANVEWTLRADHDELFARASLVVGHGGYATTSKALAYDLPLVVLPTNPNADQPMVARAVERAGAGIALSRRARPDVIADAVGRALADDRMRTAAAGLGRVIRTHGAAESIASAVLELAERELVSP